MTRPNTRLAKRVAAKAAACGVLFAVPACGIPSFRQAEPGQALPGGYNAAVSPDQAAPAAAVVGGLGAAACLPNGGAGPDNSARLGINEFFSDPALVRMIGQALATNQELKVINEDIVVARNEILSRRGAYLPFLGGRTAVGLEKNSLYTPVGAVEKRLEFDPGKHFGEPLGNYLFGTNFFWQLDIWRELRNARDAAIQRYYAAIERRNFFVTRLVADIADSYFELLALDQRLDILNQTIALQEQSLQLAEAQKLNARGTELGVQRFLAEVRRNQSERLVVNQSVVEVSNRINFLVGRYPQPVERTAGEYIDLTLHPLNAGVPAQLLQNRPDIRQAEREIVAAGLDVKVARAHFFPRLDITAGVGYQAFNPRYLFLSPEALLYNVAGDLTVPLINKKAIQADYLTANARQLQAVYNYQRVVLNAYTEVVNRLSKVENYRKSIEVKRQQLEALQKSVLVASQLFQNARADYVDVLFAQRDLRDARIVLIETKQQQLSAIVNTYQALGGGYLWTGSDQPTDPAAAIQPPPEGELLPAPRDKDAAEPQRLPEAQPLPAPRSP